MKRFCFLFCFSFLFTFSMDLAGQSGPDTIGYSRGKGELKYYYRNHEVKFLEISKILLTDEKANPYVKKAKVYRNLNGIFLGIGTISMAYGILFGLKEAIEEGESGYVYSGLIAGTVVGGVFIALSFPPGKSYKINAKKAIDIYNEGWFGDTSQAAKLETGFTQDGLTLRLRF